METSDISWMLRSHPRYRHNVLWPSSYFSGPELHAPEDTDEGAELGSATLILRSVFPCEAARTGEINLQSSSICSITLTNLAMEHSHGMGQDDPVTPSNQEVSIIEASVSGSRGSCFLLQ